ncbi:MAG: hypothetical protein Q4F84_04350 [Fibrobacter sp.]|nr:hypothetical protein [Fibrobacter sp.]
MSGFVYLMHVPRDAEQVRNADGYAEEMSNVETFELTQEEFDYLDFTNRMFKAFDKEFNLIIMECEEDTIEAEDIDKALDIALEYAKKASSAMELSAVNKVLAALRFAKERGTFLEFDNPPNPKG